MHEAPLAERAREARLDGANQTRRPVGHGEQRVSETPALEVLEERRAARRILLGARREVQQDLPAVFGDAPGAEHRLARQPGVQPLGHAVDEEVGHGNSLRSRLAKASYSCHSRSVTWLTSLRSFLETAEKSATFDSS